MNLFRIRGIQLAVHVSFFLLLAIFAFEGWADGGLEGMLWNAATLLAFFACVILHELGHSFAALHYGIGVRRILLLPIGGMAEFDSIPREPAREFVMTIAGPAVNFLIAGLLWFVVRGYPDEVAQYALEALVYQVFAGNLVMGCFNLLPAFPMDGGRILRALLATRLPYVRATAVAATIGKILCGLGIVFALAVPAFMPGEDPVWMLAVLFAFIFFVGEMEYRAVRRREAEEEHWRTTIARLHAFHPPAEEPPLPAR